LKEYWVSGGDNDWHDRAVIGAQR